MTQPLAHGFIYRSKPEYNPCAAQSCPDGELIEKLGGPEKIARQTLKALDREPRSGLPAKQKLWGGRRYWLVVEKWLVLSAEFTKNRTNGGTDR
jgi:hypothetical protein